MTFTFQKEVLSPSWNGMLTLPRFEMLNATGISTMERSCHNPVNWRGGEIHVCTFLVSSSKRPFFIQWSFALVFSTMSEDSTIVSYTVFLTSIGAGDFTFKLVQKILFHGISF
jgi:hypothetical protein